jgi:hypothetical protein
MVAEWATADPGGGLAGVLRRYWAWASRDEALPFFRLFFEVHGLALRQPERFPGFLDRAWRPWLGCCAASRSTAASPRRTPRPPPRSSPRSRPGRCSAS